MKKSLFYCAIALCFALAGCSNDSDLISENQSQEQKCDFSSFEELFLQDAVNFQGWESSSLQEDSTPKTRSSIERSSVKTITLNGYSSKVSGGNQKVIIGNTLANLMGIMNQIYILEYVTVYQDIKIEGLGSTSFFTAADSPLCGIDPNGTNYKRGYSSSSPDPEGNIRLASKCIHVICDMAARNYDMWYPCKPEEVQWKYNLIDL